MIIQDAIPSLARDHAENTPQNVCIQDCCFLPNSTDENKQFIAWTLSHIFALTDNSMLILQFHHFVIQVHKVGML